MRLAHTSIPLCGLTLVATMTGANAAAQPVDQGDPVANRPAQPINQSEWIPPEVIDARACRGQRCFIGFVGYTLLVGADGRPTDCAVTRTSGDRALDVETCNQLLRGARFKPATNAKGEPTRGRYASAVTWTGRNIPVETRTITRN